MHQSQPRRRKVAILNSQGLQKLQAAQSTTAIWNPYTKSCTLETLSEKTGLSTHTLSKVHTQKAGVDLRTLVRYFSAFNLTLEASDYTVSPRQDKQTENPVSPSNLGQGSQVTASVSLHTPVSWGMAPDVSGFCGREKELAALQQWVLHHQCRLITLLGMGGIGKTWLATKLAEEIRHEFKCLVWRSFRPITRSHIPTAFGAFLDDLIQHLPPHPKPTIPESIDAKIQHLMDILRCSPCLLVLDNVESILPEQYPSTESGISTKYRSDYQAYGELLRQLAQGRHQSCVVLTSRAEPRPFQSLAGDALGVRSLSIQGLKVAEIQQMFRARGAFQGTPTEWSRLVDYYGGNPLILGIVATTIQRLFDGGIADFLSQNTLICENIGELLDQQLGILPAPAQAVINVLATQAEPMPFSELSSYFTPSIPTNILLGTLTCLKTRSLIDTTAAQFSLQPLVGDYVRTRVNAIASLSRTSRLQLHNP